MWLWCRFQKYGVRVVRKFRVVMVMMMMMAVGRLEIM